MRLGLVFTMLTTILSRATAFHLRSARTIHSSRVRSSPSMTALSTGKRVLQQSTKEVGVVNAEAKGGWWPVSFNGKIRKVRAKDLVLLQDSDSVASPILLDPTAASIAFAPPLFAPPLTPEMGAQYKGLTLKSIEPSEAHTRVEDWVIFSDLHVKSASIETCEEVLSEVHRCAVERGAGVIFLGDFWHVRGALNVDLLNRILLRLSAWTQPVIMIPGNHDQVTLGGAVHALEPLQYAFAPGQMLLVSEPMVCLGALWVPYRRDHQLLKAILREGASNPAVGIVFCHADVKGASMNDGMKSREGLDVDVFPAHIPVYSGHYHKPHKVSKEASSLQYVGSPYQTSLSEANEVKYLFCMRCRRDPLTGQYAWTEKDRLAIDVGPKYFKARATDERVLERARSGDKVVLTVREGDNVEDLVRSYRDKKVELELREEPVALGTKSAGEATALPDLGGGTDASTLDPRLAFLDFMRINSTAEEGAEGTLVDEGFRASVVKEGVDTIERLLNSVAASSGKAKDGSAYFNLALRHVELSGFGPYLSKVSYPLGKRGLVLIRGKANDATGADSNGAGKTTLAMSVLWALTGSLDARLVSDGKAVDVAHDCAAGASEKSNSRTAEVSLVGSINGKEFSILRRRSARKSELHLTIDGVDMTQQSARDTQALIDERLGVGQGLLQRCCFFGQHSHTLHALLGLTDVRLKSELSLLVDTDVWTTAVADCKAREKADKKLIAEIGVEQRLREKEREKGLKDFLAEKSTLSDLEREYAEVKSSVHALESIAKGAADSGLTVESLRHNITVAEKEVTVLQRKHDKLVTSLNSESEEDMIALHDLKLELAPLQEKVLNAEKEEKSAKDRVDILRVKISNLESQLKGFKSTIHKCLTGFDSALMLDTDPEALSRHQTFLKGAIDKESQKLAECEVKASTAKVSLAKLREFRAAHSKHNHSDELTACPTCGQQLDESSAANRSESLASLFTALKQEKDNLEKSLTAFRVSETNIQKAIVAKLQSDSLISQLAGFSVDKVKEEKDLSQATAALAEFVGDMAINDEAMAKMLLAHSANRKARDVRNAASDTLLKAAQSKLEKLRNTVEPLKRTEDSATKEMIAMTKRMAVLEARKKATNESTEKAEEALMHIDLKMTQLLEERDRLHSNATVLGMTAEVLGPRGVQHYIFMSVIRVLEEIANLYLKVLAGGGIQLQLQEDKEGDKITKGVVIRGADGKFRERGLSQLSGGQWRRVSLALDLAFAEVVRRRGILRCNLVVMDEVLTHLDASGREAVGSVLRALVQGPTVGAEEDASVALYSGLVGGGAYEIVLVILQDLAAQELEEAFDCIDTVVKEADTSVVLVDGV